MVSIVDAPNADRGEARFLCLLLKSNHVVYAANVAQTHGSHIHLRKNRIQIGIAHGFLDLILLQFGLVNRYLHGRSVKRSFDGGGCSGQSNHGGRTIFYRKLQCSTGNGMVIGNLGEVLKLQKVVEFITDDVAELFVLVAGLVIFKQRESGIHQSVRP